MNDYGCIGLPYNTVTSDAFKLLLQQTTGNSDLTILAASTYWGQLSAAFSCFCGLVKKLLGDEYAATSLLPFLNLHHDTCTTGGSKSGVVGTSVSFIDRNWNYRVVALLTTVSNESHASMRLKNLMCSRIYEP